MNFDARLVEQHVAAAKAALPASFSAADAAKIFALLDLTSLNATDDSATIQALCQRAIRAHHHVAAVCIYPNFVPVAVLALVRTPVAVATVANFPGGEQPITEVIATITTALEQGATEIDVVFPYTRYLAGDHAYAQQFISECHTLCQGRALLKVILETGALTPEQVLLVSDVALQGGADFLKTSTGKQPIGATLETAALLLLKIKATAAGVKHPIGLKVSGGIRTLEQAWQYCHLVERILGADCVTPRHFRIGASQLVDQLLSYFS